MEHSLLPFSTGSRACPPESSEQDLALEPIGSFSICFLSSSSPQCYALSHPIHLQKQCIYPYSLADIRGSTHKSTCKHNVNVQQPSLHGTLSGLFPDLHRALSGPLRPDGAGYGVGEYTVLIFRRGLRVVVKPPTAVSPPPPHPSFNGELN